MSDTIDNIRKSDGREDTMNAVGYIRVSTEEQSREGISLDMQAAKIRAYAELNDLTLLDVIEDAGISGKSIKARPGIQRVLDFVKARKVNAVIVYKLDRLARNTVECLEMAESMDKAGVALHSITEKLDTQSALGRFFFTLVASLAEMERGIISERTAAALAQKRANREKTGGNCPYGYRADDQGTLILDVAEQRAIARMRTLRSLGYSYQGIADTLRQEGILTRKGTPFRQTQVIRTLKAA
jgi:DNA invertase Pin-like site-specific DNA recombinase